MSCWEFWINTTIFLHGSTFFHGNVLAWPFCASNFSALNSKIRMLLFRKLSYWGADCFCLFQCIRKRVPVQALKRGRLTSVSKPSPSSLGPPAMISKATVMYSCAVAWWMQTAPWPGSRRPSSTQNSMKTLPSGLWWVERNSLNKPCQFLCKNKKSLCSEVEIKQFKIDIQCSKGMGRNLARMPKKKASFTVGLFAAWRQGALQGVKEENTREPRFCFKDSGKGPLWTLLQWHQAQFPLSGLRRVQQRVDLVSRSQKLKISDKET